MCASFASHHLWRIGCLRFPAIDRLVMYALHHLGFRDYADTGMHVGWHEDLPDVTVRCCNL